MVRGFKRELDRCFLISIIFLSTLTLISASDYGYNNRLDDSFLDLQDTPSSYSGSANLCLVVNAAANGVDFISCPGGGGGGDFSFTDFQDSFDLNISDITQFGFNQSDLDDVYLPLVGGELSGSLNISGNLNVTGNITADYFFGNINASLVLIALGTGNPTVDTLKDYLDNTGSSGFFEGGDLSDGGSGTLDVSAGSGFIRLTDDDNAELQSFKWDAFTGIEVPENTTQYVYVNSSGNISLSTNEFLEAANKIKIGVVTNELGITEHTFKLGVRLEESIGEAGRFIRRVHGIERNKRLGGLIMGQSSDANRDVTMTSGQLEWGRTSYPIPPFDTSGADTFFTYTAGGQESSTASQWDNGNYDNSGVLTAIPNNKWANLFFFLEPDNHLMMVYGRDFFNSEAIAENEGVPSSSLPSRITETSILITRFTFQEGSNTATISSAFDTLFANAGVTGHTNLANLDWTSALHTGTALTFAGFDGSGSATEYTESNYLLADGSRGLTGNWNAGDYNISTSKWYNGLFNWTVLTDWLSFDGATLSFNETKLNLTINDKLNNLSLGTNVSITYGNNGSTEIPILLTPEGKQIIVMDVDTITTQNATCTFVPSPNGSVILEVCDA